MRKSVIAIIVIVLVALYTSIFVVKEDERGIKFQFSSVVRDGDKRPVIYAGSALQGAVYSVRENA